MKMDLEEEEVDGDVVVEETLLGYRTSHNKPLSGVSQEATFGH